MAKKNGKSLPLLTESAKAVDPRDAKIKLSPSNGAPGVPTTGDPAPVKSVGDGISSNVKRDEATPIILSTEKWDKMAEVLRPPQSWFDEPDDPEDGE